MFNIFLSLPEDIVRLIYAFCIDKREHWDKVQEQFFKGGFVRKNLRILPFIRAQKKLCRRLWLSDRPELSGLAEWNRATQRREICPFNYKREWDIKNKSATVRFTTRSGFRNKFSGKNPVSRWLENIDKFETVSQNVSFYMEFGEFGVLDYLPKKKNNFGVKFESPFYKKRAEKNRKKKVKKEELEKENLFIEERRELKKKMCGVTLHQHVVLAFNMLGQEILGRKVKFFRGNVKEISLKQHRDSRGVLIFSKPKGKALTEATANNYIGEVQIRIRFEDGEVRCYSPERLLERLQQSHKDLTSSLEKYGLIRGWITSRFNWARHTSSWRDVGISYCTGCAEKITLNDTRYYITHGNKSECKNPNILLNEKFEFVMEIIDSSDAVQWFSENECELTFE
jgi:hypothetical protein